jgi:flagellar biosynthesis protein FlhF
LTTFVVREKTYEECQRRTRELYGPDARIMKQKSVRAGGFLGLFGHNEVEVEGLAPDFSKYSISGGHKPLDTQAEKEKILAQSPVKTDTVMMKILSQMERLEEKIDEGQADRAETAEHRNIGEIRGLLRENDFSDPYSQSIISRIKKELPLEILDNFEELQRHVVEWIGDSIALYREEQPQKLPRVIVLVGPTGAGKTTTVAKLAANYVLGNFGSGKPRVSLITIDAFRIGAKEQIKNYGAIMEIPASHAESNEELRRQIALESDSADIFIIDTIGKSPREPVELARMQEILEACGKEADVHLVVSATTKTKDLYELLKQFEPFGYRSIIVTKLDETTGVGNIISALSEKAKPISYITDGQSVPRDIKRASVVRFLMSLDKFTINRDQLEQRYGRPS